MSLPCRVPLMRVSSTRMEMYLATRTIGCIDFAARTVLTTQSPASAGSYLESKWLLSCK